jgi:hypothetical protein
VFGELLLLPDFLELDLLQQQRGKLLPGCGIGFKECIEFQHRLGRESTVQKPQHGLLAILVRLG